jgi:hypothetical protein
VPSVDQMIPAWLFVVQRICLRAWGSRVERIAYSHMPDGSSSELA